MYKTMPSSSCNGKRLVLKQVMRSSPSFRWMNNFSIFISCQIALTFQKRFPIKLNMYFITNLCVNVNGCRFINLIFITEKKSVKSWFVLLAQWSACIPLTETMQHRISLNLIYSIFYKILSINLWYLNIVLFKQSSGLLQFTYQLICR